jgi:hypothetical protein
MLYLIEELREMGISSEINPPLQLNEYETDLYYLKLSQQMTTDSLLIYGFLPVLACCDLKIVLH